MKVYSRSFNLIDDDLGVPQSKNAEKWPVSVKKR